MLIALVTVLGVAAAALAGLLITTKRNAQADQQEADKRHAALEAERDNLRSENKTQAQALAAEGEKVSQLTSKVEAHKTKVLELTTDLRKCNEMVSEQKARLEMQLGQVADLITERSSLQSRLAESEAARAAAAARNVGFVIDESLAGDDARAAALWDLELLRSERTWRTSVAPNPAAEHSPFEDTEDPIRLAAEIEASALRENVGSSVGVVWGVPPIGDPGRSHLVLRVAQELLEAAARSSEPFQLNVVEVADDDVSGEVENGTSTDSTSTDGDGSLSGTDEVDVEVSDDGGGQPEADREHFGAVRIHLSAVDDGPAEDLLNFIPPRITSELVDVSEEGLPSVTVNLG